MRASPGEDNGDTAETNTDTVALYAQALLVLVNRIMRSPNNSESIPFTNSTWGIDNETVVAVEKRFKLLGTRSPSARARIVGLTGLSAWRRFVGHTYNSLDDHSELLVRLTQHLSWGLPPDSCSDILHAILVEPVHWTPKFPGEQRAHLLSSLVALIREPNLNNPDKSRAMLICSLAMLMLGLNQGQTRLRLPLHPDQTDMETCITNKHAQSIVDYYIQNPNRILGDEPSLLLLALAGLMEYYEHRIFDELSSDNIAKIAPLLLTLDIFSRFQTVTLPATIWLNVDLREYFVEVLANHLQHAPSGLRPPTNTATAPTDGLENAKEKEEDLETPAPRDHGTILMLNALVNDTTFWKDPACVHALRAPILHVWSRSDDPSIRNICLKAITSNLKQTQLSLYVNMLFTFDVPYKLVELMRTQEITKLRTPSAMIFGLLSKNVLGSLEGQRRSIEHNKLLDLIERILYAHDHEDNGCGQYWGEVIVEAVQNRLEIHHTQDEKLQGTYNYLKRVFLMEEASKQPMFTSKLLPLMDDRNKELKKYYIRSKVPKMWLDKLEAFKNAREGQTSSSGAGPSSGSGAPPM